MDKFTSASHATCSLGSGLWFAGAFFLLVLTLSFFPVQDRFHYSGCILTQTMNRNINIPDSYKKNIHY